MACKDCPETNVNKLITAVENNTFTVQCPNGHKLYSITASPLNKCSLYNICKKPEKHTEDYCISGQCKDFSDIVELHAKCPICDMAMRSVLSGRTVKINALDEQVIIQDIQVSGNTINILLTKIEAS